MTAMIITMMMINLLSGMMGINKSKAQKAQIKKKS